MKTDAELSLFDAWAGVYDSERNPLLALEQRMLSPLLPEVRGLDVLDAGCGTGRWLEHFAERSPRSLTGVDQSATMLRLAEQKLRGRCSLQLGSCAALPVASESVDLVVSSFVLSYLDDLESFAAGIERVLRPGGRFYLSDMHPGTEALLGWKRSFSVDGRKTHIASRNWPLATLIQALEQRGLRLIMRCEPCFGPEEQSAFASSGRSIAETAHHPAIYILSWRKPASAPRLRQSEEQGVVALRGARRATSGEHAERATLSITGDRICHRSSTAGEANIDVSGCLLLPGLINAHDHLEFGLFPRLGKGPYENAGQWARDIHSRYAEEIARYRKVPRAAAVWWGALRNLLCGVTTVCHHNPLTQEITQAEFPVRVVKDFAWAHSCGFDPLVGEKFSASRADLPFVVHAAEGIDHESAHEVLILDQLHALDRRTLLVHGLGAGAEEVALINNRQATVVLCPTSNEFLFQQFPSREWVRKLRFVILGSDSPLTAAGDLLDEIHFAHREMGLDAGSIYGMVTTAAARALRLQKGQGTLTAGASADLLAVRDGGLTPAETLVQLTIEQIDLVMLGGRVQLASPALRERLPQEMATLLEPLQVEGHLVYVRAPIPQLLATAEQSLGSPVLLSGKRVHRAFAA